MFESRTHYVSEFDDNGSYLSIGITNYVSGQLASYFDRVYITMYFRDGYVLSGSHFFHASDSYDRYHGNFGQMVPDDYFSKWRGYVDAIGSYINGIPYFDAYEA